jgi:exopolyphosphatase/guanosine-5'-triphosphate,3'-diphosphate pyrophosphatase
MSAASGEPSTAIVPRWEWQTFSSRFGPAEDAFEALGSTGVQETDELYLVSATGDTVKIRHGLLDIKALREVDGDGLERWEPVLKAEFPLGAAEIDQLFRALRLNPPAPSRDAYELDQLLDEVVRPDGRIRAVEVHKRRVRYRIRGCTAEVSSVLVDGEPIRTIAIESEDKAAVVAAIGDVGLEGFVNTSYPRALWAMLEGRPERVAVLDVGTNSVKFRVTERRAGAPWSRVVDRAEVTRLGEGIDETGNIAQAAIDRTVAAIEAMVEEARGLDVMAIIAVGTAGLRRAGNRDAVLAAVRAATGVVIRVISGEEEARLAFLATTASLGLGDEPIVVFDTGGGSSQFTFGHGAAVEERFSVDVGAVQYTERFGLDKAVGPDVVRAALEAIAADLARLDGRPSPAALVGMGGGITNITAVKHGLAVYDPDVVHGTVLDRDEIDRQIERYRSQDADGRRSIVGLQPARAEVILAGACIVRTILDKLGRESLVVSDRGLRHGVLTERFEA